MKTKTITSENLETEIKNAQYDYLFRRLRDALAIDKDKFDLVKFLNLEVLACDDITEETELADAIRRKYTDLMKSCVCCVCRGRNQNRQRAKRRTL